jgi:hypothetical protein
VTSLRRPEATPETETGDATPAPPARRRRPSLLTLVALLGAAAFVLIGIGTPLLGKASFSGADLIQVREPWRSLQPSDFVPHVPSVSDTVDSVFPNRHYFAEELHHGEVATWNPLGSGGSPLGGIVTFGFYTPINLPYLFLPTWLAPGYAKFLELLVTIGFSFLFLRRLRLSRPAGLVGGVVFAASGFMVSWTNWQQTQVGATIPALFWAAERFAQKRTVRSALPIAGAIAFMLLGGFPAVAGYACYAAAPYLIMRLCQETGWSPLRILRGSVTAGVALALGVGAVGVVLLPLAAQLSESDYLAQRGQTAATHIPPLMLLTMPVWRAFGDIVGSGYWGPFPQIEGLSYIGSAALVLIGFGLFRTPGRDTPRGPRTYFAIAAAVTIVFGYFGGPLLALAQHFPVFSNNPVFRIRSILGFFLAVLAAYGFDALVRRSEARDRSRLRIAYEVLGWAVAAVGAFVGVRKLMAIARDADKVAFTERQLLYAGLFAGSVFVLGMLATVLRRRTAGDNEDDEDRSGRGRVRTLALAIVPLIVVVESLAVVLPFWPRIPKDEFYPTTAAHRFLQQNLGHERMGARGLTLFSGTNVFYDLRSATGHAFTETEWRDLVQTADPKSFASPTFSTFSRVADEKTVQSPMLDTLSVKYLATAITEDIFGRSTLQGTAGTGLRLQPNQPVTVPLGAGGVRGVGPVLTAAAVPTDQFAALDLDLLDASGTVVAHSSRRIYTAVGRGPLTVPVAGEQTRAVSARLTLHSNAPLEVAGTGGRPQLKVVRAEANDGLRLVFADGAVLYQRTTALPRFRWADHTQVIPDKVQRLTVLDNVRDPGRVVLDAPGPAPADGKPATVTVTDDGPDDMAATVNAQGAGYLVVGDALQTGWNATLDGRSVPLVKADHAMVAVAVPAGQHTIRLDYDQPGQRTGGVVSIVSLLGLLLMGITGGLVQRRRRDGEHRREPVPAQVEGE